MKMTEIYSLDLAIWAELPGQLLPLRRALQFDKSPQSHPELSQAMEQAIGAIEAADQTHEQARASTRPEEWIPNEDFLGQLLGRPIWQVATDADIQLALQANWRQTAGPSLTRHLNQRDPYSQFLAYETRLMVDLGLSFTDASRVARRAFPATLRRPAMSIDSFAVSPSGPIDAFSLSMQDFSLNWYALSLSLWLQEIADAQGHDANWRKRVVSVLDHAVTRSAIAVAESADALAANSGNWLSIVLNGIQIAMSTSPDDWSGAASAVAAIQGGLIGATVPHEPA